MCEKVKSFFKKVGGWIAAALGVGAAVVVYRNLSGRYKSTKSELKRLRAEIDESTEQLRGLKEQQLISAGAGNELEDSLRKQSDIINDVESVLREDESILNESEQQLAEAKRLLDQSKTIIGKYTGSAYI